MSETQIYRWLLLLIILVGASFLVLGYNLGVSTESARKMELIRQLDAIHTIRTEQLCEECRQEIERLRSNQK